MRILIVAATAVEIAPLARAGRPGVEVLLTGVGMVPTAVRCATALAMERYDFALNLGLCGSFDPSLPPGAVVHVVEDRIAELGAEDGGRFLSIEDLQLTGDHHFVNAAPPANAALARLPAARGITVNTVHGSTASIDAVVRRFSPQVESMEGAAFMCACLQHRVAFAQVRAVSNVVERRNRAAWKMDEAIERLNAAAREIVEAA